MSPQADVRLGLVPLARTTFDIPLATEVVAQLRCQLEHAGFVLSGPETLVTNLGESRAVAQGLADDPPDLLIALQAIFAGSTMVMNLVETIDAPLLLRAAPEVRTGGRLRLNSFCGLNLAGHALARVGYRYDYLYTAPEDPAAPEKVRTLALAGRLRRLLHRTRIGRVGEHPAGLDACHVDKEALARQLGLQVIQVARTADAQEVEAIPENLSKKLDGLQT